MQDTYTLNLGLKSQASIPWRNFTRLKETKHFFLLYVPGENLENFEIIQKRNFSGPADCDEFNRFLQQNMPL